MASFRNVTAAVAWGLVLAAGGCAGVAVTLRTAPVSLSGIPDPIDSPYLAVSFLALVPLTAVAGWFVPQAGPWWGIVATGPHYVESVVIIPRYVAAGDPVLFPIGLMILVVLSLPPWGAGLAAASLGRKWRRRGDHAAR